MRASYRLCAIYPTSSYAYRHVRNIYIYIILMLIYIAPTNRRRLADADPPVEELSQRIRNWDVAMTRLKTDQLLTELPTKRLLMKYAQGFVDRAEPSGNLQVGEWVDGVDGFVRACVGRWVSGVPASNTLLRGFT